MLWLQVVLWYIIRTTVITVFTYIRTKRGFQIIIMMLRNIVKAAGWSAYKRGRNRVLWLNYGLRFTEINMDITKLMSCARRDRIQHACYCVARELRVPNCFLLDVCTVDSIKYKSNQLHFIIIIILVIRTEFEKSKTIRRNLKTIIVKVRFPCTYNIHYKY